LPVTVSFYVKSNLTGNIVVELLDRDSAFRHIEALVNISSANTWEYKTVTFAGDTSGVLDDDSNASFDLQIYFSAGSNFTSGTLATSWATYSAVNRCVGLDLGSNNFGSSTDNFISITGVQLEVGTVATEFEHRSFGEELALCQRYYQKSYNQSVALGTATNVGITVGVRGNGAFTMTAHLKETMRATPTTVAYSPVSGTSGKVRDLEGGDDESATITASESTIHFTGTGSNVSNAYSVHYTADAEL
jgi:hypothetical protein